MNKEKKNPLIVDLDTLSLNVTKLSEIVEPLRIVPKIKVGGFKKDIWEKFTCMICQEVYANPVTTKCHCSVTVCEECFRKNYGKCPICRTYTQAAPNLDVRRILEKEEFYCECKMKYTYGRKDEHLIECELAKINCPKCEKVLNGPKMKEHLLSAHILEVLMYFGKVLVY